MKCEGLHSRQSDCDRSTLCTYGLQKSPHFCHIKGSGFKVNALKYTKITHFTH